MCIYFALRPSFPRVPAPPEPGAGGFHPASAGTRSRSPARAAPTCPPPRLRGAAETPPWSRGHSRPAPRPRRRRAAPRAAFAHGRCEQPSQAEPRPGRGWSTSTPRRPIFVSPHHRHPLSCPREKSSPTPAAPFCLPPDDSPFSPTAGFARAEPRSQSYLRARSVPLCA